MIHNHALRTLPQEQVDFQLREIIDLVILQYKTLADEKRLRLSCVVQPKVPHTLIGNSNRILNILPNLIASAIENTKTGEVLVEIATHPNSPNQLYFEIRNTGASVNFSFVLDLTIPIIENSPLKKPFQRIVIHSNETLFTQAVKRLARHYSACVETDPTTSQATLIEVFDHLGKSRKTNLSGSTISPTSLDRAFAAPTLHYTTTENALLEVNVLVAEDIHHNQLIAKKLIEQMGCSVTLANNGREAVELISKDEFDIVFMDYQMPEMDGLTATKAIRALKQTPVIGLSGNVMRGFKQVCLEHGMNDLLAKPYDFEQIENCIREWTTDTDAVALTR